MLHTLHHWYLANVCVHRYTRYYFELRTLYSELHNTADFPLKEMTKADAVRLEVSHMVTPCGVIAQLTAPLHSGDQWELPASAQGLERWQGAQAPRASTTREGSRGGYIR